ncbi:hypothetical protein BO71DRAFT_89859 [Aspergillus ellipticus CBS 707.79]|uniref:Uncharacterized protein n=1 Tax=Aspergillus ellipticus CBS 707.79 TaxID=1448320 RepID=A0A319CY29_9EURO|nr:hypothetical protein BO71DRAFT_89859 [Aspergillus ellipticus CBS 707.79]
MGSYGRCYYRVIVQPFQRRQACALPRRDDRRKQARPALAETQRLLPRPATPQAAGPRAAPRLRRLPRQPRKLSHFRQSLSIGPVLAIGVSTNPFSHSRHHLPSTYVPPCRYDAWRMLQA